MTSSFWNGTQSSPGGEKAIIPHMKEGIQGFHISPNTAIVVCNFIEIIANPHLYWIAPRIKKISEENIRIDVSRKPALSWVRSVIGKS